MNKNNLIIIFFIILGILTRLIPHPPNFTALGAITIFAGAFIIDKRLSFFIPIITMLISDLILGYEIQVSVYISFIIMVRLGNLLKNDKGPNKIIPIAIIGSIVFFIITNFTVFMTSNMYTKDIFGLLQCYTLAIPFFINTILGNIFYTLFMFSTFKIVENKFLLSSK